MNLYTINKKMCFAFIALATLGVVTSCSDEGTDDEGTGATVTKSLTINLTNADPIDWSTGDELLVYTGAKIETSTTLQTESVASSTTATFTGEVISSGGYDIIYGVYPAFAEGSLPTQLNYEIAQQNQDTKMVYALEPTTLGYDGDGETLNIDISYMLPEVTISLDVSSKDMSGLTSIVLVSSEIYTARYLNLTASTPCWQGGQKQGKITIAIDDMVSVTEDYDDDEFDPQPDGTYTLTFKVKMFPQELSAMTIMLMEGDTDIYTTNISQDMDLTDMSNIPSLDFDYSPSGSYVDSTLDGSGYGGELFTPSVDESTDPSIDDFNEGEL